MKTQYGTRVRCKRSFANRKEWNHSLKRGSFHGLVALHSRDFYEKSSAPGFVLAEPLSGIGKEFSQNAVTSTRDRVNHKPYGGSTTPPFSTYESHMRSRESELFCVVPFRRFKPRGEGRGGDPSHEACGTVP